MAANGLYVYAIVRAGIGLPRNAGGVGAPPAPVRTIRQGALDAVISDAPPQLRARRRDLLAHQELLMRLAEEGPVLPMRFGMVAPDERTVLAQLAADETAHVQVLDRLEGCVEVNIKAFPAQNALAALVAEEKSVRQLREAARRNPGYEASVRLGEAIAGALARRAAAAGKRLHRELTPLARAAAPGPAVAGCALNTSFLVGRSESDAFLSEARSFAEDQQEHAEIRLAGPLPCYSFVSSDARPVPVGGP
nr:GvpL/GvpF family gas vesicle protein [Streptomyces sp. NBC_00995]